MYNCAPYSVFWAVATHIPQLSGFCHFGLVLFMSFVTDSRHVLFSCEHVAWIVLEPCALSRLHALFYVGAWCSDPATHVLSFGFVSGFGHLRSTFCLFVGVCGLEFARPRALLSSCVMWCFFIGCVHSCHVLCEHVAYEFSH